MDTVANSIHSHPVQNFDGVIIILAIIWGAHLLGLIFAAIQYKRPNLLLRTAAWCLIVPTVIIELFVVVAFVSPDGIMYHPAQLILFIPLVIGGLAAYLLRKTKH